MNSQLPASTPAPLYLAGILTLVYAVIGLCTQGLGLVGAASSQGLSGSLRAIGQSPELVEANERIATVGGISAGVGLMSVFALIGIGTLILARMPLARFAWIGLLAVVVIELLQAGAAVWRHVYTLEITSRGATGLAHGSSGFVDQAQAMGWGMLGLYGVWVMIKIGFFGWVIFYTRQPTIQSLFGARSTPAPRGY